MKLKINCTDTDYKSAPARGMTFRVAMEQAVNTEMCLRLMWGDLINMSGNTELSPYCGYGLCSSELVEPDRFILNVERFVETENSTISRFCFPDCTDGYFLEPNGPSSIIEGSKLRIMSGAYEVVPYSSAKYPNVLQLVGVPGRTKILTHIGNFPIDTKGCLLPGLSYSTDFVGKSRDAFEKLLYLHSSKTRFIINIY